MDQALLVAIAVIYLYYKSLAIGPRQLPQPAVTQQPAIFGLIDQFDRFDKFAKQNVVDIQRKATNLDVESGPAFLHFDL